MRCIKEFIEFCKRENDPPEEEKLFGKWQEPLIAIFQMISVLFFLAIIFGFGALTFGTYIESI